MPIIPTIIPPKIRGLRSLQTAPAVVCFLNVLAGEIGTYCMIARVSQTVNRSKGPT